MLGSIKERLRELDPEALVQNIVPEDLNGRLRAWWDGEEYTPPDMDDEDEDEDAEFFEDPEAEKLRSMRKLEILYAQWLWGEGNIQPGICDEHISLIDFLTLTKEHSVVVVGTGLGGSARAISKHCDTWITGYEDRSWLVPTALEQCKMQGLARKVTIDKFNIKTLSLTPKKFNAAICLEEMHRYSDRERIYQQIGVGLRPRGLFLLTDFIASDDGSLDHASCMFKTESELKFATRSETVEEAQKFGLGVRNTREITDKYLPLITTGWKRWRIAAERMKKKHGDEIEPLLNELIADHARVWANRIEAIKEKKLAVFAFTAEKSMR